MESKKFFKYMLCGSGIFILGLILYFAIAFFGNPISSRIAKASAKHYIEKQYPQTDYKIERVGYSFKDGNYYVHIKSASSIDTMFTLAYNNFGKLLRDDYEYRVVERQNTYERLTSDYDKLVEDVLQMDAFKYKEAVFIGGGELLLGDGESGEDTNIIGTLELDKIYDYQELGRAYGRLCIYIGDDEEDLQGEKALQRATEILMDIKKAFDRQGVTFNIIDFVLFKPGYWEYGSTYIDENLVNIEDFLYEDIYEQGLYERIKQNHEALVAYYEQEDLEKSKDLKE